MGKKCQICDGPVVNGRCSLCGMPYRNDEVMYHLNESRQDHYRHATAKARIRMREDEIPYGDKVVPNTPPQTNSAASARRSRNTAKSTRYSQTRGAAQKKGAAHAGTAASNNSPNGSGEGFIRSTYRGDITKKKGQKKGRGLTVFWILLIIWIVFQCIACGTASFFAVAFP